MLEHVDAIADGNRQRAAAPALPDHADDDRRVQRRHLPQIHRNRLGLPALFGADAWIGALRVDEAEDRQLELLG